MRQRKGEEKGSSKGREEGGQAGGAKEDPGLQMFRMFDQDGSGSLSPQEWLQVRSRSRSRATNLTSFGATKAKGRLTNNQIIILLLAN